nr:MAG TPA: hypothetical protein [Caudoviricetes sp.]
MLKAAERCKKRCRRVGYYLTTPTPLPFEP